MSLNSKVNRFLSGFSPKTGKFFPKGVVNLS